MQISRVWAMPNMWTFTIKPIRELVSRYVGDGVSWVDPFAGENSPAEITNDLNVERPAKFHQDALLFLRSLGRASASGILFDPPYSITQARQCYEGYGFDKLDVKPTSMEYWAKVKDECSRILVPGGLAVCCGWSSQGLGLNRGFRMIEVLLVPHGGSKNDTIVTVEMKVRE